MSAIVRVKAEALAEPAGASWSNALRIGNEVVMSGMTGHPATRQAAERGEPLGAYEQTLLVLGKCKALVEAAGGHVGNLYRLNVYVTDIAAKDEVGRARRDFFAGQACYPTSTLVEVSGLVFPELRVEIEASARLDVDLRTAEVLP
ncbi:Enamine deaminase RidA, house cleaning of reactive enamine intermediates, YjgF/YER057c/UK114 family [Pseudomonas delhiensis]|uniref:Enamine deaminase RidA, house cleaning of reactive enamine intermediates, YjgF/YER057c/UK114 family n=1 Tax=Pseudomonas delhiensis TaxID=366289 RepID=A0A239M7A7_9PSED|nr:RidA family protein [Pseudomonas delhiensis]SDJ87806.1 Enamine deaminase RidA, house cleaning of reactive enamine intermediates, YjgF/YER057c/UK114 family [Pseudomonas delhiensis]SNT38606.1 Enamine deaminase RidA, house cleaning of reactive enamine intermediates, YjgF/YER057c/UK114 family [Pseudomonas delhiensis]